MAGASGRTVDNPVVAKKDANKDDGKKESSSAEPKGRGVAPSGKQEVKANQHGALGQLMLPEDDKFKKERVRLMPIARKVVTEHDLAKHGVTHKTILAMVEAESSYSRSAESGKKAKGLMQLMPATAAEMAQKTGKSKYDLHNSNDSLYLGAGYVKHLFEDPRLKGDIKLVLAAYNGGASYVAKFNGKVPSELKPYVDKILRLQRKM